MINNAVVGQAVKINLNQHPAEDIRPELVERNHQTAVITGYGSVFNGWPRPNPAHPGYVFVKFPDGKIIEGVRLDVLEQVN